jgi:hypothetical protein
MLVAWAKLSVQEVAVAETARESGSSPANINAWFFSETSLEELLANAEPLPSIDDLALDDLTAEEAYSFLQAVEE